MTSAPRHLRILGCRGIPAAHGGFETFAERLAGHLVAEGWKVTVYCQVDGSGPLVEDTWKGIDRVLVPSSSDGVTGTMRFDWRAIRHASHHRDLCLTLGYNTALFCTLLRARGITNAINMDGIEWSRAKWGPAATAWFWVNERIGCRVGNQLIADHPGIERHLRRHTSGDKITMIPYGADRIVAAPEAPVLDLGLVPGRYLSVVARPEPENSVLEIVEGFSASPRGVTLAVLGDYRADNPYHRAVREAAGGEVRFVGAVYDADVVGPLRAHSLAYVHGHQVGGTNPSLVEALGAGNAVLAHDNEFNRWVAGEGAAYFTDSRSFDRVLTDVLADEAGLAAMRAASVDRFEAAFGWDTVLEEYAAFLAGNLEGAGP